MPIISLQGLRGGAGTTSITVGLAWALQTLGESVLVIDFCPDNMLRLHFNMPFDQPRGWARACKDHTPWQDSALRYTDRLDFIPFGVLSSEERPTFESHLKQNHLFWHKNLTLIDKEKSYRWVLIDLPYGNDLFTQIGLNLSHQCLFLINPDTNCHVRLHQQKLPDNSHLLLNQFSPHSTLQRDLRLLWQNTIPNFISPLIHSDECLPEALAAKQPVGEYAPDNLSTKEIITLANWCLLHFLENPS